MINLRNLAGTALALVALLAACGVPNVPIDAELSVADDTVHYDGQPQMPEITFDPPGAEIGAEVLITPEGAPPLESGTWPTDAGVYTVVVRASADQGGREAQGTLTIEPRPVSVTPVASQSKAVGEADPELTFDASGLVLDHELSGSLAREPGEDVGSYAITLGSLAGGSNYVVSLAVDAPSFAIVEAVLGDGAISVSGTSVEYDGFPQGAVVTFDPPAAAAGSVVTYEGFDAGMLPVNAGSYPFSVVAGPGYEGSASGTFVIARRPVSVLPSAGQSKAFAAVDPVFAFVASGLVDGHELSGALAREPGEDVGSYVFGLGSLSGGRNYAVSMAVDAPSFAIVEAALGDGAISVSGTSAVYDGSSQGVDVAFDPPAASVGAVVSYEGFGVGELPVDAGSYPFSVVAGPGYDGSVSGSLVIAPRAIGVTNVLWADKVYDGGTGATASATLSTAAVVSGDDVALASQLVGQFASASVGTHVVTGSFQLVGAAASNYVVAPQPTGSAAVQPRPVGLLDPALAAKTFDGTDVAEVSGTLQGATFFARGVLPADVARLGFEASFAQIGASDAPVSVEVRLTGDAATDYVLDPVPSLSAPIAAALAVVTPTSAQSKTYGDDDAALTFVVSGLVGDDAVTGALGRIAGEDAGDYTFDLGTLDAGADYTLVLAADAPVFTIEPRGITLSTTVDATVYGTKTDLVAILDHASTLRTGDVLAGALARTETTVGTYGYTIGTATIERADGASAVDVSGNYAIELGTYEVQPRPLTITAHDQTKTYGDVLDLGTTEFTVAPSDVGVGLVGEEHVTAVVLTSTGAAASATATEGPYGIEARDATGTLGFDAANYAITYASGSLTVEPRVVTVSGTFSVADKAYDGSAEAGTVDTSGLVLNGLANGDDVSIEAVASFADELVGDGKVATLTTVTLVGADAGNYRVSLTDAPTATGSMVKADIAFGITIAGTDFATQVVYDGDRTFQPNVTTTPDPVPADVPVTYDVEITYDPTGRSVGSFNPVGTYTVVVTAADPRYVGSSTQVVEVLARPITIASTAIGKTYGTLDPAMFPLLADGTTFGRNESFFLEGALTYQPGDQSTPYAVGSYPLHLGSVAVFRGEHQDVTTNYAITFANDFEIAPAIVTVTPGADQAKVYGDADLPFAYATNGLLDGDAVTGALGREAGESVGTYAFTLGELSASTNYTLVMTDAAATYAIVARPLTLTTADPVFTYGDTGLDLVAVLANGGTLRSGDVLAGDLALSDTDAGTHAFLLGTATLTRDGTDVASNYAVAFADYTMAPRPAIVTPLADQGKTYGDADPAFDYTTDLLEGDVLTGALARDPGVDVGTYAFTLGDLANPNYALTLVGDAPAFAIVARPIALEATVASKHFSTPDPDLSPVLTTGSSLPDGDTLVGTLTYVGSDVGSYPLEIGSVKVLRGEVNVSGNYAITLGAFTIDPLPVTFDLTNADLILDGDVRTHVFFGDGSEPIRGLTVATLPDGATPSFRLSYRWTHDADHVPFASPFAVQAIQGLGTYQVTVTATSANHVGATTLTVWVTDATGVVFAEPAYEALVGATVITQVRLVGPDGTPRTAGPAPIAVNLVSDAAHVGFATDGAPASSATVAIAPGADASEIGVVAVALGSAPAGLTAAVADASGPGLATGASAFATTAQLVFAPAALDVGAGATTTPITVRLAGSAGLPVLAPADLRVDLSSDPAGVVFRDAADTADVVFATIPAGASEASFRMRAETPATYAVVAAHDGLYAGVASGFLDVTVAPRPTVASIEPNTAAKAQTIDLVLTGAGFVDGVAVSFSGNDVTVDAVAVDSATQLTVRVTIAATTDVGTRHVTVTNLDGGTSTTEGALTLTVPTLSANDDGPFGVVEGGNRALSIATDLLANDTWTGTTAWGFDGVVSATGVTYGVAGDVLTLTAPADMGGSTASFTYRVRDAVFGTTATATVAIDVTLAPVDAILFTDALEFDDFKTTEYTVPTFADVFNTWPRFDGANYYTSAPYSTNAGAWYLEGGTVVQPNNVYPGVGFVSPDGFEYYSFEATLYSGDLDNDSVGLVAAFGRPDGTNVGLVAHRTTSGNAPRRGWGLSLLQGSSYTVLAEPTVDAFTATGGWQGRASRVKVERIGDIVRIQATDWFSENVATATPAYDPQSLITIDLATGVVTYRSGTGFVDDTLPSTQATAVASLRGPQSYGYYTLSQPDSRYYNIVFEGGAAQDTAILLTGYDAGLAAYTGSQVWRFLDGSGWSQTAGTIQTELDFPRDVTSVASPNPGSAYPGGYTVFGDRFRIEETRVAPLGN